MSLPIMPLQSPMGAQGSTAEPVADAVLGSFASELAASERADGINVLRAQPPLDVLEQIAAAGRIHDQLQQEGREVRFSLMEPRGVNIELHDAGSGTATPLSSAQTIELAAGDQG